MSFDPFQGRPRLRRALPWVAWCTAIAAIVWQRDALSLGTVSPAVADARVAAIAAPHAARVKSVAKHAGEVVEAGDVVVVLEAPELLADLAVARAEFVALESEVLARSVDVREADREALADLGQAVERAAVDAARFRGDLDTEKGELQSVTELLKRQEALVEKGLAITADTQVLVLKKAGLEERVRTSQSLVDAARAHEEQSRTRLQAFLATRKRPAPVPSNASGNASNAEERVAPAVAAKEAQAARVAALDDAVLALTIRAPAKGVVAEVAAVAGSSVAAGAIVATFIAEGSGTITAYADERIARRVQVGDKVLLLPSDRLSGERHGVIQALAPSIAEMPARFRPIPTQPSFARAVTIQLTDDQPPPLAGMAFDTRFEGH